MFQNKIRKYLKIGLYEFGRVCQSEDIAIKAVFGVQRHVGLSSAAKYNQQNYLVELR